MTAALVAALTGAAAGVAGARLSEGRAVPRRGPAEGGRRAVRGPDRPERDGGPGAAQRGLRGDGQHGRLRLRGGRPRPHPHQRPRGQRQRHGDRRAAQRQQAVGPRGRRGRRRGPGRAGGGLPGRARPGHARQVLGPVRGRPGARHRLAARPVRHGHRGHRQRAGPGVRLGGSRTYGRADRRLHQPRQFGRPAGERPRRGRRREHRDRGEPGGGGNIGIGFAIPIDRAAPIAERIIRN